MKTMLLCMISNKSEAGIAGAIENQMKHRMSHCDVVNLMVDSTFSQSKLTKICKDACNAGYERIYIQAATLSFSTNKYLEITQWIENVKMEVPNAVLIVFPPEQLHKLIADMAERNVYHASLPDNPFTETPPDEIQERSFDLISRRLTGGYSDSGMRSVVIRIIHAVADFTIEPLICFSPDAVKKGKEALKNGCRVITDVGMVSSGLATRFKDRTTCVVHGQDVYTYAKENGLTRSAAGIELLVSEIEGSVVAIGNAPTALVQLINVVKRTGVRPACVVGAPVGFVGAAESKELLMATDLPYISIKGNRGGTPIAVAAVNAMGCL